MLKKTLITLTLPLVSVLAISAGETTQPDPAREASDAPSGTLQKMIVENGSVTMDLDLNGLNGDSSLVARPMALQFLVGANSFFPILVFNDLLRGLEPGSMALIPAGAKHPGYSNLPAALGASLKQLVVEKLPSDQASISPCAIATRDSRFLMLKEASTITTQLHSRLASQWHGSSFQKSLRTRLAAHQTPAQSLEKSPSARRCNRSKSTILLTAKRNRWSCRHATAFGQTCHNLVHGPDVIVGESKTSPSSDTSARSLISP